MIPLHTIISDIAKEASRILARDSHYFVHPNIPRDKLAGAMSYVDSSVHPNDVVLLLDDTVFGSAKDGLALTDRTLYVREKFCEPDRYDFADMSSISIRNEFFSNVLYIDNVRVAALSQPSKETLVALCLIINTYIKQFQGNVNANAFNQSNNAASADTEEESDGLIEFEFCMIATDIMAHFGLLHGKQWTQKKQEIAAEVFSEFQKQSYLYSILQQRLNTIEPIPLDQSVKHLMALKPHDEIKLLLMWQAFQMMAEDESDLMKVETRMRQFALLLNVFPAPLDEFCHELRKRLGYGDQQQNNSRARTGNADITWACQILEVDAHHPTLDVIQHAYRIKIREFHPDKHQSLPPSVRQLVESKAQELNQARDILMAHFQ